MEIFKKLDESEIKNRLSINLSKIFYNNKFSEQLGLKTIGEFLNFVKLNPKNLKYERPLRTWNIICGHNMIKIKIKTRPRIGIIKNIIEQINKFIMIDEESLRKISITKYEYSDEIIKRVVHVNKKPMSVKYLIYSRVCAFSREYINNNHIKKCFINEIKYWKAYGANKKDCLYNPLKINCNWENNYEFDGGYRNKEKIRTVLIDNMKIKRNDKYPEIKIKMILKHPNNFFTEILIEKNKINKETIVSVEFTEACKNEMLNALVDSAMSDITIYDKDVIYAIIGIIPEEQNIISDNIFIYIGSSADSLISRFNDNECSHIYYAEQSALYNSLYVDIFIAYYNGFCYAIPLMKLGKKSYDDIDKFIDEIGKKYNFDQSMKNYNWKQTLSRYIRRRFMHGTEIEYIDKFNLIYGIYGLNME